MAGLDYLPVPGGYGVQEMTREIGHPEQTLGLWALCHKHGPSTEAEAIERHAASGNLDTNRAIVLRLVEMHQGSTAAELTGYTHLDVHEVRRRLTDLKDAKQITQEDKRVCHVAKTKAMTYWPKDDTTQQAAD